MDKVKRYATYLLVIAGCGGLLFDFGGTIIGPALPYIGPSDENPGSLGLFSTAQVSHLSSAVVMCAALACLVAGWLAEKLGRKLMMLVSAAVAVFACLPICLMGENYAWFFLGRAMQGVAAGFIGAVLITPQSVTPAIANSRALFALCRAAFPLRLCSDLPPAVFPETPDEDGLESHVENHRPAEETQRKGKGVADGGYA